MHLHPRRNIHVSRQPKVTEPRRPSGKPGRENNCFWRVTIRQPRFECSDAYRNPSRARCSHNRSQRARESLLQPIRSILGQLPFSRHTRRRSFPARHPFPTASIPPALLVSGRKRQDPDQTHQQPCFSPYPHLSFISPTCSVYPLDTCSPGGACPRTWGC